MVKRPLSIVSSYMYLNSGIVLTKCKLKIARQLFSGLTRGAESKMQGQCAKTMCYNSFEVQYHFWPRLEENQYVMEIGHIVRIHNICSSIDVTLPHYSLFKILLLVFFESRFRSLTIIACQLKSYY